MNIRILIWIFSLCICTFYGALGFADDDALVVGTNAEYPPFATMENGSVVGFDIDIAYEVCTRIGKTMVVKDYPTFDVLVPELMGGRIDFIAAGMTPTAERAKRVSFTKPYISGDPLVIVTYNTEAPISSLQDLRGKSVVVNEGYTADLYMSDCEHIGLSLVRLMHPVEGFLAIMSGRGDAFVTAQSTVQNFFSVQGDDGYSVTVIDDGDESYALAVSKKNDELLHAIQPALDSMEIDGTIASLKSKWGLS